MMTETATNNDRPGRQDGIVRTLSDVKAGDMVLVVYQTRRRETQRTTRYETVTRVGRKYGYLGNYHEGKKFDLTTGQSVHNKDCNARENAMGFDVYLSESDYVAEQFAEKQKQRLQTRLVMSWGRIVDLPPEVVNEIHGILDAAKIP